MKNPRIAIAIDMVASGEIGVKEAADLAYTTSSNISHYLARRGIDPKSRTEARTSWMKSAWEQKVTNLLRSGAVHTVDAVRIMRVIM